MKSVYRKLDKKLFLIVKKNRTEDSWQFPQGIREKGEPLRLVCYSSFYYIILLCYYIVFHHTHVRCLS
jgi:hypothetical protein